MHENIWSYYKLKKTGHIIISSQCSVHVSVVQLALAVLPCLRDGDGSNGLPDIGLIQSE